MDEERKNVLNDIAEDCHDNMYVQTFVLPDISGYSEEFKDFLEKDLMEISTLVSLEQAGMDGDYIHFIYVDFYHGEKAILLFCRKTYMSRNKRRRKKQLSVPF